MALDKTEEKVFASILADGKIHVSVPEGTEGAVTRDYETSDGTTGKKTELVYNDVVGQITDVAFFEGNYGRNIQVTICDGAEKPVSLSLSTASNYGEDLMKKILNVDLTKYVKIVPYSFTDEKGKGRKGVTIWQKNDKTGENEKVKNYFYDEKKKVNVNGYPEPKKGKGGKPLTKDQWKIYFAEVREFMIEKITEVLNITEKASTADADFESAVASFSKE